MKTLNELTTDLDVFEYIKDFLLTQNSKSIDNEKDTCLYRFDTGNYSLGYMKCAIGCLIKDEFYNEEFETKSITDLGVYRAVANSVPNWEVNKVMLSKLQNIHDVELVEHWEDLLNDFYDFIENGKYSEQPELEESNG